MTTLRMDGWLLLLLLALAGGPAAAQPVALSTLQESPELPAAGLAWLQDLGGTMTIDEARRAAAAGQFAPADSAPLAPGFSDAAWWQRFELANDSDRPGEWRIVVAEPTLDDVQLFRVDGDAVHAWPPQGRMAPAANRQEAFPQAGFPGAPMLFAQRHPCDVVLSGFMQPIGVVNFSNIEAAADYYDAMMSIWTAARETLGLNVHTVVYEELVQDTEPVLRAMLEFLGLEWDERFLDHRSTAKARGTIVTPSYDQVTEPISTRPVGRWKRYEEEMAPALPILMPWAERLGYAN